MGLFFLLSLILFISPFLCIVISTYLLKENYNNSFYSKILFFVISLCFGYLNTLKTIESDLVNYLHYFNVSQKYNLLDYLYVIGEGKEYLYFLFTYISYYLFQGNFNLFLIFFTGISYFLVLYSIRILDQNLKLGIQSYFLAIIIFILFPNIFSISSHLMRQFLASSFIIVFIVKNTFEGNVKSLPYFIIAILVHSSSFLFGILLAPVLNKKISFTKGLLFFVSALAIFYLVTLYSSFLSNIPVINDPVNRFIKIGTKDALSKVEPLIYVVSIIILILFYFGIFKNKAIRSLKTKRLFYIALFLVTFIVVNYNNIDITVRFSFYTYFFFPLSFYFFYSTFKIKDIKIMSFLNFVFLIIFVFWFRYKINNGAWTYENVELFFYTLL